MKLFRTINAVKTDKAYLHFVVQPNKHLGHVLFIPKNLPRTLSNCGDEKRNEKMNMYVALVFIVISF